MEKVRKNWKMSENCGELLENFLNFWKFWRILEIVGKFDKNLVNFRKSIIFLKILEHFGKCWEKIGEFLDILEIVGKLYEDKMAIYNEEIGKWLDSRE